MTESKIYNKELSGNVLEVDSIQSRRVLRKVKNIQLYR